MKTLIFLNVAGLIVGIIFSCFYFFGGFWGVLAIGTWFGLGMALAFLRLCGIDILPPEYWSNGSGYGYGTSNLPFSNPTTYNPASGLPMNIWGVDSAGNPSGVNYQNRH